MTHINFNRKLYILISIALIIFSLFSVLKWGLKYGIDFTGGTMLEISYLQERPDNQAIIDKLKELNLEQVNVQPIGDKGVILRLKEIDEKTHQEILGKLGQDLIEEKRFESIGSVVGNELKGKAVMAIIFSLIAIFIYIALAFRKISRPVPSWKYGFLTVLALFHDLIIAVGLLAILGHFLRVEVDLAFVAALLTIVGFSVHDTIVVFDRARENLLRSSWTNFAAVINQSVNQSLTRCINTTLTTILSLLAIYFFGGETIKYFALVLIVGIASGAYSSIVANCLIVVFEKYQRK